MADKRTPEQVRAFGQADGILAAIIATDGPEEAITMLADVDPDDLRMVVADAVMWLAALAAATLGTDNALHALGVLGEQMRDSSLHIAATNGECRGCLTDLPHRMRIRHHG